MKSGISHKKYFIAGLLSVLPVFLTIYILWVVFKLVGRVLTPPVAFFLGKVLVWHVPSVVSNIISSLITIGIVWLVGVLMTHVVSKRFFKMLEDLIANIPFASGLYGAFKQLFEIAFGEGRNKFQRVVLVEFPRPGMHSLGFLMAEGARVFDRATGRETVHVFVPTTPNPTTGFFLIVKKSDVIMVDISVDDAFKLIISGGLVMPPDSADRHRVPRRSPATKG